MEVEIFTARLLTGVYPYLPGIVKKLKKTE